MASNVFQEVAALLGVAVVGGTLALLLRQPVVVGFILAGVVSGPGLLGIISAHDQVYTLSKLGIAVLLFVVGLRLDLGMVKATGPIAVAGGAFQMALTALAGYAIGRTFGLDPTAAWYLGAAAMFSSTVVVVKLLSDRREVASLHGRIAIGILIVQDVVVLLLLGAINAFSHSHGWGPIGVLVAKAVGGIFLVWLFAVTALPWLLNRLSRSTELLILFSIAYAVVIGAVGELFGLSKELGAFIAGLSLASTQYREAIASRLTSLRDFLLLFFFVNLGAGLDLEGITKYVGLTLALGLLVLVGKPLLVMIAAGVMCYRKRTGLMAGLALAQISEFSLILASMGLELGHITKDTATVVTLLAIVTIALSTYLVQFSGVIYRRINAMIGYFERTVCHPEDLGTEQVLAHRPSVVLFGLGSYGGNIGRELLRRGYDVVGVDFDPSVVEEWLKQGNPARYGDAEDPEILHSLPLMSAEWVVSTVPDKDVSILLVKELRRMGYQGRIAVAARYAPDIGPLHRVGPDLLLNPNLDAAREAADRLAAAIPVT